MSPELELCWGTVPEVPILELIDLAAATGFHSITVRPSMYLDARAAGITASVLRRRLHDAHVAVGIIDPLVAGLPNVPEPAVAPEAFRRFVECTPDDCWRAAVELECPVVNVAQFLGPPAPLDAITDAVAALATRGVAHGINVSVEFIPGTGIPDLAAACHIAALDGVGVMFDTWHFHRSGAALDELTRLRTARLAGIQLNDAIGPPPAPGYVPMVDRLLPGDGTLPLAPMLGRLLADRPPVRVGVEVFSAALRALPPATASQLAFDAARRVLTQIP